MVSHCCKGLLLSLGLGCALALPVSAAPILDPVGDFLPSYTGPHNGDLDVVAAEVFFDGSSFLFTSTSAAPIGTTPGGVFVWGVNRGAGFVTFPVIAPGVTFDAVVVLVPEGGSFVTDLAANVQTPLDDVDFGGADLTARVPLSTLPSLGVQPSGYTVNLWPRSELSFVDEVVSDFAPDNSNAAVTLAAAIPEPGDASLLAIAVAGLMLARRRFAARTPS